MLRLVVIVLAASTTIVTATTYQCGKVPLDDPLESRVIGGHVAEEGSWPWIVSVQQMGSLFVSECTGSIIARRHVLTAAHCATWQCCGEASWQCDDPCPKQIEPNTAVPPQMMRVLVGSVNRTTMKIYNVSRVIVHPRWKVPESEDGDDISILELKEVLDFDDYVQPICLVKSFRERPGDTAYFAGFGKHNVVPDPTIRYPDDLDKDEKLNPDYSFDDVLRENIILLKKWSACRAAEDYDGFRDGFRGIRHPEYVICADTRMRATRSGDSGGPLMINRRGTWFQVGIVQSGDDLSNNGYYTRVTAYCKWIKKETYGDAGCRVPPR